MKRKPAAKRPGRVDRFGTHKEIVAAMPDIVSEHGPAAYCLLTLLWDRSSFKLDGRTVGDMRVSALARLTGFTRKTTSQALAYLTSAGWITPADGGKGFTVWHSRNGEQDGSEQVNPE